MESDNPKLMKLLVSQEQSPPREKAPSSASFSTKDEFSISSESIEVLQDEGVHEEELKVALGKLTRMGARNQMWRNKFVGFNVIVGYLTTYATYARFCHFLDQYGLGFVIAFVTCMFFIGLPLVYLEMALGQFTTLNAVAVFKRIAPIASGLGVSMLFLSLIVAIVDYSMLFSFISVLGNAVRVDTNEMPWHRCSNRADGPGCRQPQPCPKIYEEDFYDEESPVVQNQQDLTYFFDISDSSDTQHPMKLIGDQCIRPEFYTIYKSLHKERVQYLPYVATQRSIPALSFLLNKVGMEDFGTMAFRYPSTEDIFTHFLSWLLILVVSVQGRPFLLKMCIAITIIFNSIMLTVLSIMLFAKLDAFMEIGRKLSLGPDVWATAVLVVLNTLRVGQGGLFFLGAQNKFSNNLAVDALAVTIYLMCAIFLYSTVHVFLKATGAPFLFKGSMRDYISFLDKSRKESLYSQFFVYWTTTAELIVYRPYEPFLQLAMSCGYTALVINNIAVVLEVVASSCVTSLDFLSDEASTKAIMRSATFLIALCSFFLNSELGFATTVTIENTVIPAATAFVVLSELIVVGVIYGFPRVYANVLSMSSHEEEDKLMRRVSNLFHLYFWRASPFFILASLLYAYPHPPDSMGKAAWFIIVLILMPTAIACYKVSHFFSRIGNIRLLFVPDYNLWGPRMADDRANATRIIRKLQIPVAW
ncbi:hypothetical protein RB195_007307 [Necator americanus]|uniref:Sodium:neurotransmitter symporter family protein n=1 Tax=Necator americanus TaxID=51031 RepID=A0ABR1BYA8_NECAM